MQRINKSDRKKLMKNAKDLIKEVLEKGYLISLGTEDENGIWVSDVIYVHTEKLELYWLSETKSRHSTAILNNPQVAATITLSNNPGEKNIGLQIEGKAEKIEGDILEIAIKHRLKRKKEAPKKEGEILGKGESWYKLTPTKIELIYEPIFGFEKKKLEL